MTRQPGQVGGARQLTLGGPRSCNAELVRGSMLWVAWMGARRKAHVSEEARGAGLLGLP